MRSSAYEQIKPKLAPRERLLWSGRPRRGIRFKRGELFLTCLLFLIGIALLVFGTSKAVTESKWDTAPIFISLIIIYAGVLLFITEFLTDAWRRRYTAYGLTDRQVIIVEGRHEQHIWRLPLHTLFDITLHKRSGTISCLGTEPSWHKKTKRGELVKGSLFRLIVDGQHVYELLRDAQAKLLTSVDRPPPG